MKSAYRSTNNNAPTAIALTTPRLIEGFSLSRRLPLQHGDFTGTAEITGRINAHVLAEVMRVGRNGLHGAHRNAGGIHGMVETAGDDGVARLQRVVEIHKV